MPPWGGHAQWAQLRLWEAKMKWQHFAANYRGLQKAFPYAMGFAICFCKGAVADVIAQKAVEKRKTLNTRRLLGMALFSGSFCGCTYHFCFNVAFPRIFGVAQTLRTAAAKAAADAIVVFPFMYMPIYFCFDEVFALGNTKGIVARWHSEIWPAMKQYKNVWPATMLISFTVVPVELRVTFVAGVSFMWLICLSTFSH